MAITRLPEHISPKALTCAICASNLSLDRATAGLFDADNKQMFACVSHLYEVEKLIIGWADFFIKERQRYLEQSQEPVNLIYKGI